MLPVHLKQLFELPFQLLRDLGWSPHLAEMNDDLVLRTYVKGGFPSPLRKQVDLRVRVRP